MKLRAFLRRLLRRPQSSPSAEQEVAAAPDDIDNDLTEIEEDENNNLPTRTLYLGIDYGTSWSKLIFRDYNRRGGERSYVVRFDTPEGERDYRSPSLVVDYQGKLYFGWQAHERAKRDGARSYASLKIRMAISEEFHGHATELPTDFAPEDLAALNVAYLLQLGTMAAEEYASRFSETANVSMKLGAPISQLEDKELGTRFRDTAQLASELVGNGLPDLGVGIDKQEALGALKLARDFLTGRDPQPIDDWVCSEALAGLVWAYASPTVAPGLYAAVDVGAGTTSATWFQVSEGRFGDSWMKNGMLFFGAACEPPGADAVDQVLAKANGVADPADVRLQEAKLVDDVEASSHGELRKVYERVFKVYEKAFQRAYEKNVKQSAWYGASLFLLGGGTRIPPVRERLEKKAWVGLDRDPPVKALDTPDDLMELDDTPFQGESAFVLVAYGLSHISADLPNALYPGDLEQFIHEPSSRQLDHEEMYSD